MRLIFATVSLLIASMISLQAQDYVIRMYFTTPLGSCVTELCGVNLIRFNGSAIGMAAMGEEVTIPSSAGLASYDISGRFDCPGSPVHCDVFNETGPIPEVNTQVNFARGYLYYCREYPMTTPQVSLIGGDAKGCGATGIALDIGTAGVHHRWEVKKGNGLWLPIADTKSAAVSRIDLENIVGPVSGENLFFQCFVTDCIERPSSISAPIKFFAAAPSASLTPVPPQCFEGNGAISVDITSESVIHDFKINIYNYTQSAAPIGDANLQNSHNVSITIDNLIGNFNLHEGTYTLDIANQTHIDTFGDCSKISEVYIPQPSQLNVTTDPVHILCHGQSDGRVTATSGGGTAPYAYAWTPQAINSSTETISNLPVGDYSVEVTDAHGCKDYADVTLTEPPLLSVTIDKNQPHPGRDISCSNSTDGSLTAIRTGGAGADGTETYSWSNGGTGATLDHLGAGDYSVIVTDVNRCHSNASASLNLPPAITFDFDVGAITCPGASTGTLTVTNVDHQYGPVSYLWSTNATTETIQNRPAGVYQVTVTDELNCSTTSGMQLTDPPGYSVTISAISDYHGSKISCHGEDDGELTATVPGITSDQLATFATGFEWTFNGVLIANGTSIHDLSEGSYRAIMTYGEGCTAQSSDFMLIEPSAVIPHVSPTALHNGVAISCPGKNDGTLLASASGGTGMNYSYQWEGGPSSPTFGGLSEGTYTVHATDINGCVGTVDFELHDPLPVTPAISVESNFHGLAISCVGASDGILHASAIGGTGSGYSYTWENGPATQNFSGLPAGMYRVIATDLNGCQGSTDFQLNDPSPLTSELSITSNYHGLPISCIGAHDLSLRANSTGGAGAATFLWSTGNAGQDLANLPAGSYSVVSTDANGCQASSPVVEIHDPEPVIAYIEIASDYHGLPIRCFGGSDGILGASAQGGTNVFSFLWDNGTIGNVNAGLSAGGHQVTATDQNGCFGIANLELQNPEPVEVAVVSASNFNGYGVSCKNAHDGFIEAVASGGTNQFTFGWTPTFESSPRIENLSAGQYFLTIADQNGCGANTSHIISEPSELEIGILDVTNITCFGGADGAITVQSSGGILPHMYSREPLGALQVSPVFTGLRAKTLYQFSVTDLNGCKANVQQTLAEPKQIVIESSVAPAFCDKPVGAADAFPHGGVGPYVYQWSDLQHQDLGHSNAIHDRGSGVYKIVVHDASNCPMEKLVAIPSLDGPSIEITNIISAKCSESGDGSAEVKVSGDHGPFTVQWSDGSQGFEAHSLHGGSYLATARDINECVNAVIVDVSAPSPLYASLLESIPASCAGDRDGEIEVSASGGTAPYEYHWANQSGPRASNLGAGYHQVTISDSNGCVLGSLFQVTEPTQMNLAVTKKNVPLCFESCNGSLEVSATGGNGTYTYMWNTGAIERSTNNLCAGIYTMTATDQKGCQLTKIIALDNPMPLGLDLKKMNSSICHSDCIGSIEVFAHGGSGPYHYSWSNGLKSSAINQLCSGQYNVTVTDNHNCTQQQSYEIVNPVQIQVNAGPDITLCVGQSVTVHAGRWKGYSWTSINNVISTQESITVSQPGNYTLTVHDFNNCLASDSFIVSINEDLLRANFLLATEAKAGDTVVVIDITWPPAEQVVWTLPSHMDLILNTNDIIKGKFNDGGVYEIKLQTKLAGCSDELVKQIKILEDPEQNKDGRLGYDQFLKSFELYPNPNSGKFEVEVEFAEISHITLTIWNSVNSLPIATFNETGKRHYVFPIDARGLSSGVYVLRVDYEGGSKAVRFLVE